MDKRNYINKEVGVSDFTSEKKIIIYIIRGCLLADIIHFPIPINTIEDKLKWKFTSNGNFFIKTATLDRLSQSNPT